MWRRWLPALLLLAACGGTPKEPPSLSSLESKGSLQNCEATNKTIALHSAQCDFRASGDVELVTFGDKAARDTYVRLGRGFGGTWVVGDLWAAGVRSGPSAASALADVLDGKLA